ncbi:hypothetical protein H2198_000072 [Neophaeococcomyces mojaviensis]|uniref:Uncharacterized protein n=1 Tax=Neophaeococcomyces mojaviensis TaxID=3383035 RepID=A0ACC3ALA4_9EURO|nr:hypothetical protein H2198_000072 [Knufia sp. JES_112]
MAGELILLTGSTGHIGFATLVEALKKGYHVRAAVRRESAIEDIKRTKSVQPYLSQLSFVLVSDITAEGAFDEHVKGVDYVVHIASPLPGPSDDYEKSHMVPAVQGTLSILYSALKEPNIKRVVITASELAIRPRDDSKSFTADSVTPDVQGPFDNPFIAYGASKIRAHNAVRKFIETESPRYSVINIMPSFVLGRNQLATTPEAVAGGSNMAAMFPVLGVSGQGPFEPIAVYINDVAFLHIAALDQNNKKIKHNDNFGASWPHRFDWTDVNEIVKKRFPDAIAEGVIAANGENKQEPNTPFYDTTRTEEVFDFKFKDLETAVVDLVEYYLEVKKQAS